MKAIYIVCVIALLGAMMVMPASATTKTFSPDNDTFVDLSTPDAPCDDDHDAFSVWSWAGKNKRALIHFDLSSIPSGATIVSAKLKLYTKAHSGHNRTHNIHRTKASWTENTVTWNNQPDIVSTPTDSTSIGTAVGWKEWDVTTDV